MHDALYAVVPAASLLEVALPLLLKNAHQGDEDKIRNRLLVCKHGCAPTGPTGM